MKGLTRHILVPVLLAHLIGLLVLVLYHIVWADRAIVPEMFLSWIVASVILAWIEFFIPLTVSGLLLGFSIGISSNALRGALSGDQGFARIAGKSVAMVIILTAGYVLLSGFAYGAARHDRDHAAAQSARLQALVSEARLLAKRGLVSDARERLAQALLVSPMNQSAVSLRDDLVKNHAGQKSEAGLSAEQAAPPAAAEGHAAAPSSAIGLGNRLPYADNLRLAEEYADAGDPFSALYFLRKAEALTDRPDPAFVSLKSRIESEIRGASVPKQDEERRKLLEAKEKAIVQYLETNQPIAAYYQLLEVEAMVRREAGGQSGIDVVAADLAKVMNERQAGGERAQEDAGALINLPATLFSDGEFRHWMPVVLQRLEANTFFLEEASALVQENPVAGMMFLNQESAGMKEYVYAQAVLPGPFNLYLLKPEIIQVDAAGKIVSHRKAAYGKVVGENLLLKSISRVKRGEVEEALVLAGGIEPAMRNVLVLHQKPDTVWNLTRSRFGYESMSFPELFGLLEVVEKAGYDLVPLQSVILGFLLQVLCFPSLCFLAMGWGWSHRNRYLTRPLGLVLLMGVAVPLLVVVLYKLYLYVGASINSSLLILGGFGVAILVTAIIQAAQLLVSLVYMAGQPMD